MYFERNKDGSLTPIEAVMLSKALPLFVKTAKRLLSLKRAALQKKPTNDPFLKIIFSQKFSFLTGRYIGIPN